MRNSSSGVHLIYIDGLPFVRYVLARRGKLKPTQIRKIFGATERRRLWESALVYHSR